MQELTERNLTRFTLPFIELAHFTYESESFSEFPIKVTNDCLHIISMNYTIVRY
jgi:hypothetical protein